MCSQGRTPEQGSEFGEGCWLWDQLTPALSCSLPPLLGHRAGGSACPPGFQGGTEQCARWMESPKDTPAGPAGTSSGRIVSPWTGGTAPSPSSLYRHVPSFLVENLRHAAEDSAGAFRRLQHVRQSRAAVATPARKHILRRSSHTQASDPAERYRVCSV